MCNTIKSFLFALLLAPLSTHAMESQPDRIELGKQLVKAAWRRNWDTAEKLIKQDADLNQQSAYDATALMHATAYDKPEIVRMLIDAGADLHQQDCGGWTALMFAARDSNQKIAQMLIDAGTDLNLKSHEGWAALIIATLNNRPETAQLLIDAGADLNQQDRYGQTALLHAVDMDHPQICYLIVQARLRNLAQQKKRVYTTLLCLKHMPGEQYSNLRNIFIPTLRAMVQEVRQPMIDDINRVENDRIRHELLALCNAQQNPNYGWSSLCAIQ